MKLLYVITMLFCLAGLFGCTGSKTGPNSPETVSSASEYLKPPQTLPGTLPGAPGGDSHGFDGYRPPIRPPNLPSQDIFLAAYFSARAHLLEIFSESFPGYLTVGNSSPHWDRLDVVGAHQGVTILGPQNSSYTATFLSQNGNVYTYQISGMQNAAEKFCVEVTDPQSISHGFKLAVNSGDYDKNGTIEMNDINLISSYFGQTVDENSPLELKYVDADNNRSINITDITFISSRFGATSSSDGYPAPCN